MTISDLKLSKMRFKTVLVKFAGEQHPQPVPIEPKGLDDTGIWFRNSSLMQEFIGEGRNPPFPLIDAKSTWIFVPLSQIEWLMVPDTDDPK
jgi:hypothetical protein